MNIIISPILWVVLALSIGIPVFFIVGARYVVYLVGRDSKAVPVSASEAFEIPTFHITSWQQTIRTLLFVVVLGVGTGIILLRYVFGIGAVTNLSNHFPWGIWIGFDVMGGVALAAGAFDVKIIS